MPVADTTRRLRPRSYVIVGAGSAGCIVAARLTEDPDVSVLLLEAGGRDTSIFTRMPAAYPFAVMSPKLTWRYESGPEPHLNGRMVPQPRGRVLGGSSSINGMAYVRGHPSDYDGWAGRGLESWSWDRCLPYFRKMETFDRGADAWRGVGGPVRVQSAKADEKLFECFLRAGEQAGYGFTDDYNGFRQEGVHRAQINAGGGMRSSSARAYLHPAMKRPNLTVMTGALVEKVVVDGGRAVAVRFRHKGEAVLAEAEREVVLCAGAIGTPQLLMLSGIGDPDHLREMDVPLVCAAPGVGSNLEDHIAVPVRCHTKEPISVARHLGPAGRLKIGVDWMLRGKGLGTSNFFEVGGFVRSRSEVKVPDIQFEFLPMLRVYRRGKVDVAHGFQFHVNIMRPTSTGQIRLRSRDPSEYPSIVFNYLHDSNDVEDMIRTVKVARNMIAQPAWDGVRGAEIDPGEDVRTDADILSWLRANAATEYHPACTCRMGTDDLAVVDENGSMRGMAGLRIVDASIIPRMITANLNAPVMMMAEKIADVIKGCAPLTAYRAPHFNYDYPSCPPD